MKLSLYQKLSVIITSMFILITSLVVWWTNALSDISRAQAEQALHIGLAEHLAGDNPLLKEGVYDYAGLENLFHTLMILGPSFEFYFVSPNGEILTYSAKPGQVKRNNVNLVPLIQLLENPEKLPIYGDDPRDLNKQKIFSVAPVLNEEELQGYLYVIIGSSTYDSIFEKIKSSDQLIVAITWLGAALFVVLLVLLLLFKSMTSPLTKLTTFVKKADSNHFKIDATEMPIWDSPKNEIHCLGNTLNMMLTQINTQLEQLKEQDDQRRDLLAHLSHDLRTPLASLQGYLELIEKSLGSEHHEIQRHISVSLKNSTQLKNLIDQIFELAHLESGQSKTEFEVFNLGELIYDTLAKFALRAEKEQIDLVVTPQSCDFQVYSDIGKLERILSNLIENALRHTQKGGSITLSVQRINDAQLNLQIKDTGIGINKQELPYIFEARYQGSNSQGCKKSHAGLGLAITERLIKLIQSDIKVSSSLNEGTAFDIRLPRTLPPS